MTNRVNFWYVAAIVMPILLIANLAWAYEFGLGQPYQLQKVADILTNVHTTSNIDSKIAYLQQTVDGLQSWHGNPQYWYPTQYEDLDLTRASIQDTIDNINALKKDPNNMAYQQAVANLDSSTNALHSRLYDIAGSYGMNPNYNSLGYGLLAVFILGLPLLKIADKIDEKVYESIRAQERNSRRW